jgi:chemotaxis response regulator CheB
MIPKSMNDNELYFPKKVLVVHHSERWREKTLDSLMKKHAKEGCTPAQAIPMFKKNHYDIIIIGVNKPKSTTGIRIIEEIRYAFASKIPIIYASGLMEGRGMEAERLEAHAHTEDVVMSADINRLVAKYTEKNDTGKPE